MRNIVYLIICVAGQSFAQLPAQVEKLRERYPDEIGLYLNRSKLVTVKVVGDSLVASSDVSEEVIVLRDEMKQGFEFRIFGNHFLEVPEPQVSAMVWEGKKYKEIKMTGLQKKRDDDNSIFYDDSYFYGLSFPVMGAGSLAKWSYSERYRDVRFLNLFSFSSFIPQVHGSFIVRTSKGVELSATVLNDETHVLQYKNYNKGGYTYHEWSGSNINKIRAEDNSPKGPWYIPQVICYVKSYPTKAGRKNVLSGLDDLVKWYYENLKGMDEPASPELVKLVTDMRSPKDSELDMVKKIFYWVQNNIRYIAFEDGMRGFVPHKPSYVFEKRYGDCKDMASLIVGMIHIAGLKSYYTWIGTRDLPYRYTQFPTPIVDNHMIATYIDPNGRYYFLDGTSNYTSVELPSEMIQGKEALVVFDEHKYEVKDVPEIPYAGSNRVDSVSLKVDGNSLVGSGIAFYGGYQKINLSYDIDKVKERSQKENLIEWIKKGNNKFYLNSFHVTNLYDQDQPVKVEYAFRISDYINSVGDEMYVNLNLDKTFLNQYISETRTLPMEMDYKYKVKNICLLETPKGYKVEYLPPGTKFSGKIIGAETSYSVQSGMIRMEHQIYLNSLMVTKNQFGDWNEEIKALSASYKEAIIFQKIK